MELLPFFPNSYMSSIIATVVVFLDIFPLISVIHIDQMILLEAL